jgi:hypothetical protein
MNSGVETIHWTQVKNKVKKYSWAKATVEALKLGFDAFTESWKQDPPTGRAGFTHAYFCKVCAVRLDADLSKPYEHKCPSCDKIYTEERFHQAWKNTVHGSIVTNLERAAVLANLYPEESIYSEYIRHTVLFYAEHYKDYEVYGEHAGLGKIFPQCLAEAIFVISIERTLRMVKDLHLFSDSELVRIAEGLFRPAGELLKSQINKIHNIHVWMIGAVASAAHILKEQEWLDFAIDGQFGWLNQIEQGVTEDGLWFEISSTYHFYTLSALLSTAWIAKENGRDLFSHPKLKKMLLVPMEIVYDNGEFPAYNDCWYGIKLSRYAGIYEQLGGVYEEAEAVLPRLYVDAEPDSCGHMTELGNMFPTPASTFARHSIAALLYGVPELPDCGRLKLSSRIYPSSGIGILENEHIRAGLKFTNACGGHDHYDKLSIDICTGGKPISVDLGTSGYGIDRTHLWNKAPLSHNMVIVNAQKQKACSAELVSWEKNRISVRAGQAYEGAVLSRTLVLSEQTLMDTFEVECNQESVIDWVFHCEGELGHPSIEAGRLEMSPAPSFEQGNGYDQLADLQSTMVDSNWRLTWKTSTGTLTLLVDSESGTQVYTGYGYGVHELRDLGMVIVRRKSDKTTFTCQFIMTL